MTSPARSGDSRQDHAPRVPYRPRCFNKRSRQRFERDRTAELLRHLGREATYPERIIIARVASIEFELRKYDHALDSGAELSGHLLRARLAAENRLRLDLQALGLKPAVAPRPLDALEYLRQKAAAADAAA